MRKLVSMIVACVLGAHTVGQAVEVKTVVDGQLMGGQNFYNGSDSSFGGIASLTLSPFMKFDEKWSLVPVYFGNYRGTKQVTDLVGGGTLFQDSQSHTFSTKAIRTFGNGLKVKAVGGYGMEYLRETKDEDWGEGLYDNRRVFTGPEAEWSWANNRSVRLAYDYYRITFPNYQSLESTQGDSGLGRELSAPDVLNNSNHMFTAGSRLGLPYNGFADVVMGYTMRSYGDQHLVVETGDLAPETRDDSVQLLSLAGTWPFSIRGKQRLFGMFGYSWSHLYSNQNHYDAAQLVYNANYYAYVMNTLTTQWTLLLGDDQNPWSLTLNGSVSRQNYSDRLTQDAEGIYGTSTTRVDTGYFGLGFSYPITHGFRLAGNAYFGWSDSNNHDNRTFQYHYDTQTYLMGFTYAY